MEDLINEEEFIKPKHSLQELFRRFYVFSVILAIVLQLSVSFLLADVDYMLLIPIYILLPVVTAVWMFTSESRSFLLERKDKIVAILYLMVCYLVPNFAINVIKILVSSKQSTIFVGLWTQFIATVFFFSLQTGMCLLVILVVSRLVKKKMRQPLN